MFDQKKNYKLLLDSLPALLGSETNRIANLSNVSALLNQFLPDINWVGFYLIDNQELVLGPFQGLPACIRIPIGKGVCGTAAATKKVQNIKNVHKFEGNIPCDANSLSEIVLHLIKENELLGVLDIDSPILNRFDDLDQQYLEQFVAILIAHL